MSKFLELPEEQVLYRGEYYFIIFDGSPLSEGHCLIISNDAKETYFDLSEEEKRALPEMIDKSKDIIENKFSPDGYNIGMNCGAAAGQIVMHFHCHVIPRYKGDTDDPSGGIRGIIPGKQS